MGRVANLAAPEVTPFYVNCAALWDEHINVSGYYLGATLEDVNKDWKGYAVYESFQADTGYKRIGEFSKRAVICRLTAIPETEDVVDYRMIDRASVIEIETLNQYDELEEIGEDEMMAGKNRFLIGKEIIGASSIKQIAYDSYTKVRTYQLSNLVRGLKDTFPYMTHEVGEYCVWLDGPGIYFQHRSASLIGNTSYMKAVGGGGAVAEAIYSPFTFSGGTLKTFRPLSLLGTRNGGNDITITWKHQSRFTAQLMQQGTPVLEELMRYKIRILQTISSEVSVRETIVLAADESDLTWTYTSAQQVTDGKTPGNNCPVEIVQMSSLVQDSGNASRMVI